MSLARAFTMRAGKRENASTPPPIRTGSVKAPSKVLDRSLISPPVALLSTTNMLSYNAPDISTMKILRKASSSISSGSSGNSGDDSDVSSTRNQSRDTYNTDTSSVENSPTASPTPQDSTTYFQSKSQSSTARRSTSTGDLRAESASTSPRIPERAPSHSKKAHELLAKKRSLQHISAHSLHSATGAPTREHRTSIERLAEHGHHHPFGRELEQLAEVAEEVNGGARGADCDADAAAMKARNLAKWTADDYIAELAPLFARCFGGRVAVVVAGDAAGWI